MPQDIKLAIGSTETNKPQELIKFERRPQAKVLSYGPKNSAALAGRGGEFKPPVHDYSEIARAVDTESYLARSIQKHREYILKEGWEITGQDPATVEYVKGRLREFELITGITTNNWLRELTTNLITFHTAFLVFKRDASKSTGRNIRLHGKEFEPIAGLFPMDPVSVTVSQNQYGRPLEWKQELGGQSRIFDADDVMIMTIDKKTGFVFGTPYCVPVLDDIRALRRLEELSELVTHKHLFPLFQYIVGTETQPEQQIELPDGSVISEVDLVRGQIEEMPTEGGIVTPFRHEIKLIGAQDKIMDLMPYIEHFEKRVMAGLRLSGIDVGRGETSNKSTAQVINQNLVDAVRDYQQVIMDTINAGLFDILVFEGGFDLTEETRVMFRFPNADREEDRTSQQHGLSLFQSNALTSEELRRDYLRREPITPDQEQDTFHNKFEKPMLQMQLDAKVAQANARAKKSSSVKNTAKNKVKPANQYGTLPSKPKYAVNDTYNTDILLEWYALANALSAKDVGIDSYEYRFNKFRDKAARASKRYIHIAIDTGLNEAKIDCNNSNIFLSNNNYESFINKTIKNDLQKIAAKTIIMLRQSSYDNNGFASIFDSVAVELKFMLSRHQMAAYRFGYAQACRLAGFDKITIGNETNKETIDLNKATIKDLNINLKEGFWPKVVNEISR